MGLFPVVNGCLYVLFLKSLYPEARKTSDTSGHYLCYELRYVRRLWKHFSDNGLDELTTDEVKSLAEFRRELAAERGREFALEGHRWFDLVRLGLAVDYFREMGYSLDSHNLIFPIPQNQIEIVNNPSILWQNPGFN